jgi:hypothetical protein
MVGTICLFTKRCPERDPGHFLSERIDIDLPGPPEVDSCVCDLIMAAETLYVDFGPVNG